MADESLRPELERVYKAYVDALRNQDLDAFLAAAQMPQGSLEDEFRAGFAEFAEQMRQIRTEHRCVDPWQPTPFGETKDVD